MSRLLRAFGLAPTPPSDPPPTDAALTVVPDLDPPHHPGQEPPSHPAPEPLTDTSHHPLHDLNPTAAAAAHHPRRDMADYESILEGIQRDVAGFIGATIVDLDSGMSLASRSAVANFDLDVASAYNSEMVKGKFKTMKALGLDAELEDMLLTLSDQLHLIKVMENNQTFIYVAASRANTNLALLRRTVAGYVSDH